MGNLGRSRHSRGTVPGHTKMAGLTLASLVLIIGSAFAISYIDSSNPEPLCSNLTGSSDGYETSEAAGFPLLVACSFTVNSAASSGDILINASWGANQTQPLIAIPPLSAGKARALWQVVSPCSAAAQFNNPPSHLHVVQKPATCGGYQLSASFENLLDDDNEDNFGTPTNGNVTQQFSPQSSALSSSFWLPVPKSLNSTDLHIFIQPKLKQTFDEQLWESWRGHVNLTVWRGSEQDFGCGSLVRTDRLTGELWGSNLTVLDVAAGEWLLVVLEPVPYSQLGPYLTELDQLQVRLPVMFHIWGTARPTSPAGGNGGSSGLSMLAWVGIIGGVAVFVVSVVGLVVWKRKRQSQAAALLEEDHLSEPVAFTPVVTSDPRIPYV